MIVKINRATWCNGVPLTVGKAYDLDEADAKMLVALKHAEDSKDKPTSNQTQKQRTMPVAVAA